jgi:hypothetical protein
MLRQTTWWFIEQRTEITSQYFKVQKTVPCFEPYCAFVPLIQICSSVLRILVGIYEDRLKSTWTHSESELYGCAVTVSLSKYLPWQAMRFLQLSTHFSKTCCRPFSASFRRIVEQAVLTFHVCFSVSKALPPLENRSQTHCIISIGLMDEL